MAEIGCEAGPHCGAYFVEVFDFLPLHIVWTMGIFFCGGRGKKMKKKSQIQKLSGMGCKRGRWFSLFSKDSLACLRDRSLWVQVFCSCFHWPHPNENNPCQFASIKEHTVFLWLSDRFSHIHTCKKRQTV